MRPNHSSEDGLAGRLAGNNDTELGLHLAPQSKPESKLSRLCACACVSARTSVCDENEAIVRRPTRSAQVHAGDDDAAKPTS